MITRKKIRHWEEISKNRSVKSSDTSMIPDVSNRIFIMGYSIVKHVRAYEPSRNVENCKISVKSFSGAR